MRAEEKERIAWVPRCPHCGARMRNPKVIAGSEPPRAPRLKNLISLGWPCASCGASILVGEAEDWVQVEEG